MDHNRDIPYHWTGRSTAFIGHGREYVARKSDGEAFVVPLNTPGTKTQPHLTEKRMGEAQESRI